MAAETAAYNVDYINIEIEYLDDIIADAATLKGSLQAQLPGAIAASMAATEAYEDCLENCEENELHSIVESEKIQKLHAFYKELQEIRSKLRILKSVQVVNMKRLPAPETK